MVLRNQEVFRTVAMEMFVAVMVSSREVHELVVAIFGVEGAVVSVGREGRLGVPMWSFFFYLLLESYFLKRVELLKNALNIQY